MGHSEVAFGRARGEVLLTPLPLFPAASCEESNWRAYERVCVNGVGKPGVCSG